MSEAEWRLHHYPNSTAAPTNRELMMLTEHFPPALARSPTIPNTSRRPLICIGLRDGLSECDP
jgi:hypothetical protein